MEVVITLYPLDKSEVSETRTFSLTKEKREVNVGRASKNPDRGVQPEADNAIFKCPIMSRSHARFTASPIEKRVYIQDLGSTHGTFIGALRVRKGEELALACGDVVTFGVRVTNGASVYPAKPFRIEYSWQPRQSPAATITTTSRVFTVPDSDNDEYEVVSVHTRESSVQILESNTRKITYSVPSVSDYSSGSDDSEADDDDPEASSSQLGQTKDSRITTPEQYVFRAFGDVSNDSEGFLGKALDLKGPKLQEAIAKAAYEGSSQNNPINLADQSIPDEQIKGRGLNDRQLPLGEMQTNVPKEVDMNETESEDEGPEVLPIQSTTKRSDIADLLNEKPVSYHKPRSEIIIDCTASSCDPSDAGEFQVERTTQDMQRCVAEDGAKEGVNPANVEGLSTTGTTGAMAGSNLDGEGEEEEEEEEDGSDDLDSVFPRDFDEASHFDGLAFCGPELEQPKNWQALPTPSGFPSAEAVLMQRAPSPSDAALARTSSIVEPMPRRSAMYSTGFPNSTVNTRFPEPPSHTWNVAPPPATDHPLWRDNLMRPCRYNASPSPGHALNPHSSPFGPVTQQPCLSAGHDPYEDLMANQFLFSPEPLPREAPTTRAPEDPSARLHISNLVNSYSAEPSRSIKRKAAEMNADTEEVVIGTALVGLPPTSQETPLPDAQTCNTSIAADISIPREEATMHSINSKMAEVATKASLAEEPVHKRAKTTPSSSGIGKFLFGVGVGAVGLAATFLATIPAHVQEEARLGL